MKKLSKENPKNTRFRAYKAVSKGHFRKVIPACWLFSIRIFFPGGIITGFIPSEAEEVEEQDE